MFYKNTAHLAELMSQPNPPEIVKTESRREYKRWASRLQQELAEPELDMSAIKALIGSLNHLALHVDVVNAASIRSFHEQMTSRSVANPNFKSFKKNLAKSLVKL
jgi:hypothetical protein